MGRGDISGQQPPQPCPLLVTASTATAPGWRAAVQRHGEAGLTDVQDARYLTGIHSAKSHCVRCRQPLLSGRRFNAAVAPTGACALCSQLVTCLLFP